MTTSGTLLKNIGSRTSRRLTNKIENHLQHEFFVKQGDV